MDQADRYSRLEQGARYLAAISTDSAERHRHLGWANRYCRLRVEAQFELNDAPTARAA